MTSEKVKVMLSGDQMLTGPKSDIFKDYTPSGALH